MPHTDNFGEIALLLGLAALLGALGQKLRQPLIIMFLAAGILAGPSGLGIIESYTQIELLAHIGIALLLFIVGLRLDLNLIRTIGPVALATGLGQIGFTSIIGFVIAMSMGLGLVSSVYVSVALTFSSTIIIVKLLSDKKEIDSLHGQIAVGFLIVQDIAAIIALIVLTTFRPQEADDQSVILTTTVILTKGVLFFAAIGLLMRYVLPGLLRRLARSQEMLVLFAVAWAVLLSAASEWLGFSKEVGAFLAGVSLASTQYRDAIGSRLSSLRDFLLLFFFIDLGARLEWGTVGAQLGNSLMFSLFVLIGNPLIVLVIMGVMGYRRRTSFLAGLTVAQISEFSLIVAAMGVTLGHITEQTMGLVTLVGVVTIFVSTYMILYSGPLYRLLSVPLKLFERKNPYRETADNPDSPTAVDVILFGLGNYGGGLAEHLHERRKTFIGVDFDPNALDRWRRQGVPVFYGDLDDPELYEALPLQHARWVVSAIRSRELNLALVRLLGQHGYTGKIALTAVNEEEAELYEDKGVQVVFRPFHDAAEQAVDSLTHAMEIFKGDVNWPIAFSEIRMRPGSAYAGKTIRTIPLRSQTGAFILAVSRAGRVHYEPGADFQVYPGDRLVVMGTPEQLGRAETLLSHIPEPEDDQQVHFVMDKVTIAEDSPEAGQTLADLHYRAKHNVTVVGICRGDRKITSPGPDERLSPGDELVVIGTASTVAQLKAQ